MDHTIILDHINGLEASLLLKNGRLEDILIAPKNTPHIGTIFRAKCKRPLKGSGGMMVELPNGKSGFLRQGKGLKAGEYLHVQVTGYSEEGKAIPVTPHILFKSRYAIITPRKPGVNVSRSIGDEERKDELREIAHNVYNDDHGLILRSSCAEADLDDIESDILDMASIANGVLGNQEDTVCTLLEGDTPHALAWREWSMPAEIITQSGGIKHLHLGDQLNELCSPYVAFDSGHLYIEQTRALIAVDVNTGGDTSPASALKANLATCRLLPTQLRIRGFAGQICIDFAPMPKSQRKQVEHALKAAFKLDPIETSLIGWTHMGLFELQRKRERPNIIDNLGDFQ